MIDVVISIKIVADRGIALQIEDTNVWQPTRRFEYVTFEVVACLPAIEIKLGRPVYRDEQIVVFDLKRKSGALPDLHGACLRRNRAVILAAEQRICCTGNGSDRKIRRA
jgi:hypothetical protein